MIIKLITHKRNKDGTVILYLDKGLTQEDRHELMDLEGKPLELKEQTDIKFEAGSEYERGFQEGISEGIRRVKQAVDEFGQTKFTATVPASKAEDGCQK